VHARTEHARTEVEPLVGQPGIRRFGITAHSDGQCDIWLDQEYATVLTTKPHEA